MPKEILYVPGLQTALCVVFLSGIMGLNPTRGKVLCPLSTCCTFRYRCRCRLYHRELDSKGNDSDLYLWETRLDSGSDHWLSWKSSWFSLVLPLCCLRYMARFWVRPLTILKFFVVFLSPSIMLPTIYGSILGQATDYPEILRGFP
jgi:hypothetical protein